MLEFRLKAYRKWLTMAEPAWSDNRWRSVPHENQ
jgi:Fe-S cluster assembly protein SufB